jgi:hypothetical protein
MIDCGVDKRNLILAVLERNLILAVLERKVFWDRS